MPPGAGAVPACNVLEPEALGPIAGCAPLGAIATALMSAPGAVRLAGLRALQDVLLRRERGGGPVA